MTYQILIGLTGAATFPLGDLGSHELRRSRPRGAEHVTQAATTLGQRRAPPGSAP
jgi:hypothetical protein